VGKIVRAGTDVTLVGWGGQMLVLDKAAELASQAGINCEVIDLRTLLPWDREIVIRSVMKTGKAIVSHEAPVSEKSNCVLLNFVSRIHFFYNSIYNYF
jgi:2-oxoisovalerate dehydrogenase E1 component beta subunit